MKQVRLLAILVASFSSMFCWTQTWTRYTYSPYSTEHWVVASSDGLSDPVGDVGITFSNVTFDWSPSQVASFCEGDSPSPGPTWDWPLGSLFATSYANLTWTGSGSNSSATSVYVNAAYDLSTASETWVLDSNTQASREYQMVSNGPTYSLVWVLGGGGGGPN
ncbi:MAG: hypothetical protein ACYC96_01880 [Fimbriimonadaceae bacterium]